MNRPLVERGTGEREKRKATHDYQKICNDSDQLVKLTFLFTALRHLGRLGRHFEIAIGSNSDLSTTERTKQKIKALVW